MEKSLQEIQDMLTEAVADLGAANEVHQGAVIVGMDAAGSLYPTAGTGLQFRTESGHKGIEQDL